MAIPYQERIQEGGSASNVTFFGSKIPPGKVVCITELCGYIYTDEIGDYNTAKYIALGVEINNNTSWHMARDVGANQLVIRSQNCVWLKEGDRPKMLVEATAATTTYVLVVNGLIYDEEELAEGEVILPGKKVK